MYVVYKNRTGTKPTSSRQALILDEGDIQESQHFHCFVCTRKTKERHYCESHLVSVLTVLKVEA
jgi:hypothetical protein